MSTKKSNGGLNRLIVWIAIIGKSSKLLAVIKSAKLMKPLISVGTMLLSVFAYSFAMGIPFAIGFVLMIFIHELGHVFALKRRGVPASLPVFIPFLGAAVFTKYSDDRDEEAYSAYAGPLVGTLGALALMLLCLILPSPPTLLVMLVYVAFIINLFNLIPISPLDGGRVTQAIGPKFVYAGVAALLVVTLLLQTPGMLLIWILILSEVKIRPQHRFWAAIGLTVIMVAMMLLGIGTPQPFWLNVFDVILAAVFSFIYWFESRNTNTEDTRSQSALRPQLSPELRKKWLYLYGALVIGLITATVWWHGFLPAEALTR